MNNLDELVNKSKNGDENAFTSLIQYIQNDLYRVAIIKLNSIEDTNEAIQNTIINIYKNIRKLKQSKYFKTWAIKILINEINKIYKANKRKEIIEEKAQQEFNPIYSNTYEINRLEENIDLENALNNLSKEEKLIVVLRYNSQYTFDEISKIMNANLNTVKSKFLRAKEKLKKSYERGDVTNERK